MRPIRVLLVDDHLVLRQGLRSLLSQYPDLLVVGETGDEADAIDLAASLQPDVVLLDIRLGRQDGLELARRLRRLQPELRIIILTAYDDETFLLQAAQAGVHGYLLKSASAEVLAEAIRAVHAGERRLAPALADKAYKQLETACRTFSKYRFGLTDQDIRLLSLIASGATVRDIARSLYLSERSVKRKIRDILAKMGVANRAQAVAEAVRLGLV